jgi:hypothetical protein
MMSRLLSRWTFLVLAVVVTMVGVEHRLGVIAVTHANSVAPATVATNR